ncbi:uncharacterized protein BJ171DRAFT_476382 [Polychytrium aggregatum]|uniref:uncharacterized protein n=1 Tax=Polychytrium aggregatum TaxID=110093 RepID=UPI0022FDB5CB|nr:uncharacterized protein BJ171DRAFT_476382 [Polychytrium aggregatum]KAI9202903.1 hypothetical protein BJ171DRAFT_476382 [Polychytrium aggregatum]
MCPGIPLAVASGGLLAAPSCPSTTGGFAALCRGIPRDGVGGGRRATNLGQGNGGEDGAKEPTERSQPTAGAPVSPERNKRNKRWREAKEDNDCISSGERDCGKPDVSACNRGSE